jgi:hypothetical protein
MKMGWVVNTADCRNGDDGVGELDEVVEKDDVEKDNDDKDDNDDDEADDDDEDEPARSTKLGRTPRSPLQSNWIVPLIKPVITAKPNATNANLHHVLHVYSKKYALTRGVLQSACDKAKLEVFGKPSVNAIFLWLYMTS